MAKCPNCGVTMLGSSNVCPKCYYNIKLKKVDPSYEGIIKNRLKIEKEKIEEEKKQKELEEKKQKELDIAKQQWESNSLNFKSTTGYGFEGYKIVQYLGIRSGEVVLGTGVFSEFSAGISDLFGNTSVVMARKITSAKEAALKMLTESCLNVCANAVIGVDIDIMTLGQNMIVACANGTAVKIEKE